VQHVEVLAFVFVDAFGLDVEQAVRVDGDALGVGDVVGQVGLASPFYRLPAVLEGGVVGESLQAP
jgi:hypothetical protein